MTVMQNHQVNVLVVDPDTDFRGQIHEVLMEDGYACRAVGTAEAALRSASEKAPSLLICDVNLGNESGLALVSALREFVDCPVIFISDSRKSETMEHARRAGATYFLSKPFDPTVLMELVDKALWMPHLVRRHVDSAAHKIKAPVFSPATTAPANATIRGHLPG